jgi:hypothetical protein
VKVPVEGCGKGNEGGDAAGVGKRWDGMSAAVGRGFVRGRGEREEGCPWLLVLQRIVCQDWLPLSSPSHSSLCHWPVFSTCS